MTREKRRIPRVHVLLDVVFGDGRKERDGKTMNVSRRGMSVSSSYVVTPGLRVAGKIVLPDGSDVDYHAEVMWARKSRSSHTLTEQHAMGFRFLDAPGKAYDTFLQTELKRAGAKIEAEEPKDEPTEGFEELTPTTAFAPGLEGRTMAVVSEDDLAFPTADVAASLSGERALAIMEEAVLRALSAHTPAGKLTLGIGWELSIAHNPPTPVGTPLVVIATLIDASSTGQRLRFQVSVKDGIREVASATHTRVLVKKKPAKKK